jgi:hypothetical protein
VKQLISIALLFSFLFATAVPAAVIDCCCKAMQAESSNCCASMEDEADACCSDKESVILKKFEEKAAFFQEKSVEKSEKPSLHPHGKAPNDLVIFAFNRALQLLLPTPIKIPERVPCSSRKIVSFSTHSSHRFVGIDFSIWRC